MENKKNCDDLLQDLFEYFRKKYGNNKSYEVVSSDEKHTVVKLAIPNSPAWAKPGLVLRQRESGIMLGLDYRVPEHGYTEDLDVQLELHSSFNGGNVKEGNCLWATPNDHMGISHIFTFTNKELDALRIEILAKANELFYSGEYNTDRDAKKEKAGAQA